MNEKVFKTLEFDKILGKLKGYAVSPMGKEEAENLKPSTEVYEINKWQNETSDAAAMIMRKGAIPLGGLHEIRPQLKRVSMGGTLGIDELMNICEFLYVCRKIKNYSINENKDESYEHIGELFDLVVPLTRLEKEISRVILSETEIADDASAELRSIRREIKVSNDRIRDQLNSIINSQGYRNMLQDYVITIRNDRYCVPVKSEYRNSFNGMIHDQSNTGSTLFMEPMSVVQLNNKIKELKIKEKAEIEKIILELVDACLPTAEKKKMYELLSNELLHYVEPHHGKCLIDMIWNLSSAVYHQKLVHIEYQKTNGSISKVSVKPLGITCSEYYFYLIAYYGDNEKLHPGYPTIYRIDRIQTYQITDESFSIPYRDRFEEGEFRKRIPFMYGGKLQKKTPRIP